MDRFNLLYGRGLMSHHQLLIHFRDRNRPEDEDDRDHDDQFK